MDTYNTHVLDKQSDEVMKQANLLNSLPLNETRTTHASQEGQVSMSTHLCPEDETLNLDNPLQLLGLIKVLNAFHEGSLEGFEDEGDIWQLNYLFISTLKILNQRLLKAELSRIEKQKSKHEIGQTFHLYEQPGPHWRFEKQSCIKALETLLSEFILPQACKEIQQKLDKENLREALVGFQRKLKQDEIFDEFLSGLKDKLDKVE